MSGTNCPAITHHTPVEHWPIRSCASQYNLSQFPTWCTKLFIYLYIMHHHHVQGGLGLIPVPFILKMKLIPPSLPRSSYVSSSFGLYCSACLGILFASVLCMCCSHFFWYCFISFTISSAPVFSLIQRFFFFI